MVSLSIQNDGVDKAKQNGYPLKGNMELKMLSSKPSICNILGCSLILLFSGLAFGQAKSQNNSAADNNGVPTAEIERFTSAMEQIKHYYVQPVDDKVLFDNAIRGMLAGLDPHSSYLDIADYAELQASTQGEFAGLGVEVDMDHDLVRVVSPVDDTPAFKAGLKPGDLIVKIDKQPVQGLSLTDAVNLLRGPKGSVVNLTIIRKNTPKPLLIKITRDIIHTQSIKSRLLEKGYGYVRIVQFQAPTADDLVTAIKQLEQENKGPLQGFILDLRNNPGGLLDSAISVSDDFLNSDRLGKNSLIVYTKGRTKNSDFKAKADPSDLIHGVPMVVLINNGSASAAEIVAGALQDHKRAIVMGQTSFGKGSVQTVLPLDDEHAVKITTALYYTPNGRSIQAKGIVPDIMVDELNVTPTKDNSDELLNVSEADLEKHLTNGDKPQSQSKADKAPAPVTPSIPKLIADPAKDYQLNQALTLLKGLNTVAVR